MISVTVTKILRGLHFLLKTLSLAALLEPSHFAQSRSKTMAPKKRPAAKIEESITISGGTYIEEHGLAAKCLQIEQINTSV